MGKHGVDLMGLGLPLAWDIVVFIAMATVLACAAALFGTWLTFRKQEAPDADTAPLIVHAPALFARIRELETAMAGQAPAVVAAALRLAEADRLMVPAEVSEAGRAYRAAKAATLRQGGSGR